MISVKKYFDYLKRRSLLGSFYRNYFLYPKLSKLLESKVLDIGCGIGDFLKFRPNTIGVDINQNCVDWCNQQGFEAKYMKINSLPFLDSSFDSVMLDNVLEHIENPDLLLKEVNRVLKNKGIVVVAVPGILGYAYDDDHKKFYSKNEIISTLDRNGFSNEFFFGMPFNLDFLSSKLRQYCIYARYIKKV